MRLILIRHGQTVDNVNGALGTEVPGPGLTALGQSQASAVPAALSEERIDAIAVSTMRRTHATAAPLASARDLEPKELDGLQEISAGDLEGRSDWDAVHTYLRTMLEWWNDFSARIPGGESGTEFFARYDAAVRAVVERHPEGTVALFSHGAAIRTWASWVSANIDADFSRVNGLENTGIVILEGSPDTGWTCVRWQDTPLGGSALEDDSAPDPLGDPD
ncbi:histidine phosphatase family protein [Amnibacterium flavum]|uniref:Histidine phosphatase family protein n=1 Tax=Amnibacterium flavum TaxID=2173173 RepID=A0A2V1HY31_9MICO|nr:histidine phosphatase family protein [Amnibacterium flavum]PVZ95637.1 histidine phosphatase family protein [Amnibacterium flavum]